MGRLQFIFIYSTLFMRLFIFIVHDPLDVSEVCDNAGVEILWKGIASAQFRANRPKGGNKEVLRITKSGGDVNHMTFLGALVEQSCCINWVNGCETGLEGLSECSYTCKIIKFFSSSGYSVLQQLIGKAPILTSKIHVRLQDWKTPVNTLLLFGYCVGERVSQQVVLRYGF